MSEVRLAAEIRTEFGKGGARRTRRAGKIPAVIYGHGADPQHVSLPAREFTHAIKHGGANVLLTLDARRRGRSWPSRRRSSGTRSGATSSTSTCWPSVAARRSPSRCRCC